MNPTTDIHPDAVLRVEFQRTLRVPDDGRRHHLPPGLGREAVAELGRGEGAGGVAAGQPSRHR